MRSKPLYRSDIERAMRHTKSNRAASRYLGVSYQHYKPYAKLFIDETVGKSLFDIHKNQRGKGIPKHMGPIKVPAIDQILSGEIDVSHFHPDKIKRRLIVEGYLLECCNKCGFNERRVTDYKVPLLLNFKNGNKKAYYIENLELLCYNCFFLHVSDPFKASDVDYIEDFNTINRNKAEKPTFDLDKEMLENMQQLGIL